ncbi:MAG: hypothetical protein IJ068_00175 [Bacilli bacterium]|nr:hypothetical protein [Bacilli bacterium]
MKRCLENILDNINGFSFYFVFRFLYFIYYKVNIDFLIGIDVLFCIKNSCLKEEK